MQQIEFAQNFQWPQSRAHQSEISLVAYSYIGKIESEHEIVKIIDYLFSDDQPIVQYTGTNTLGIVPLKDVMELAMESGQIYLLDDLKQQLTNTLSIGMDLIKLEWKFNGERY